MERERDYRDVEREGEILEIWRERERDYRDKDRKRSPPRYAYLTQNALPPHSLLSYCANLQTAFMEVQHCDLRQSHTCSLQRDLRGCAYGYCITISYHHNVTIKRSQQLWSVAVPRMDVAWLG